MDTKILFIQVIIFVTGYTYVAGKASYLQCEPCHEYRIFGDGETWKAAKKRCAENGGWLATIHNSLLHQRIKATVNNAAMDNDDYWIGLHDKDMTSLVQEGQEHTPDDFVWLHQMGESYTKWADDEPNDDTKLDPKGQNTVQLRFRRNVGDFDDDYEWKKKGFVCQIEKDAKECGSAGTCQLSIVQYDVISEYVSDKEGALCPDVDRCRETFPKFDEYPVEIKTALVDGLHQGDYEVTDDIVNLINDGKWEDASFEYTGGDKYNNGSGERKRMDANADAMMKYGDDLEEGLFIEDGKTCHG